MRGQEKRVERAESYPACLGLTHLGKRSVQVNTNKNVLSFQIDLIRKSFHVQFGVCGSRHMKGTLHRKIAELVRSDASGAEEERTKHGEQVEMTFAIEACVQGFTGTAVRNGIVWYGMVQTQRQEPKGPLLAADG